MKKKVIVIALTMLTLFSIVACSQRINSAYDLDGKRIGVRGGTTGAAWVNANLQNAGVNAYESYVDAVVDLKKGVLDAVVAGEMTARELVAADENIQILTDIDSFFIENYGIGVRKGDTELLNAVNSTLQKIRSNGEYDLLHSSFIMPSSGTPTVPTLNIPAGGAGRTLRVGTASTFPPFGYKDGDQVVGFDVSLAQLIGREYGANIEIVDMPFIALISSLLNEEIDLIAAAMTITEDRMISIDFSDPYFATEQVILSKK